MSRKIVLYNDDLSLSVTLTEDSPDLTQCGFQITKAQVMKGQWIAYNLQNYDPKTAQSQVLTEGPMGIISLTTGVASIRYVRTFTANYGVSIYQNNNYGGRAQYVYDSAGSVDVGGASSVIVSGGNWNLYLQPNFVGASTPIGPGLYPNAQAMGFPNDQLQSIAQGQ